MNTPKARTYIVAMMVLALIAPAMAEDAPESPMDQAFAAYAAQDYQRAIELFTPIAQSGNAEAQYVLGLMYHRGRGTPVDGRLAAKWYAMAANQNHPAALCNLGIILRDGLGEGDRAIAANPEQAMNLLRRACYLENVPAMVAYGAALINGNQSESLYAEGVAFMQIAAGAGDEIAKDNLTRIKLSEAQQAAVTAQRAQIEENIAKVRQIRAAEEQNKKQQAQDNAAENQNPKPPTDNPLDAP